MRAVGMTGTREGMTDQQKKKLWYYLDECRIKFGVIEFHHGDCVGADADGYETARSLGHHTIAHPPKVKRLQAFTASDEVLPPKSYGERNQDIVDVAEILFGFPKGYKEEYRGGTWSTIRRARLARKNIMIIWPDGRATKEENAGVGNRQADTANVDGGVGHP